MSPNPIAKAKPQRKRPGEKPKVKQRLAEKIPRGDAIRLPLSKRLDWAFSLAEHIDHHSAHLALVYLTHRADERTGETRRGKKDIGKSIGCTERHVRNLFDHLEARGVISRKTKSDDRGRWPRTVITLRETLPHRQPITDQNPNERKPSSDRDRKSRADDRNHSSNRSETQFRLIGDRSSV